MASATLPRGTATLLFSDIEGSTALLARVGRDAFAQIVDRHRTLMRMAVDAHPGVVVDSEGGAGFVAFARAEDAVSGAAAAQRALAGESGPADGVWCVRRRRY